MKAVITLIEVFLTMFTLVKCTFISAPGPSLPPPPGPFDHTTAQFNFGWNDSLYDVKFYENSWPYGVVWFDIDPHVPPEMRDAIQGVVDYINNDEDLCVMWLQKTPYNFDDSITSWVTFLYYRKDTEKKPYCGAHTVRQRIQHYIKIGHYCIQNTIENQEQMKSALLHEMMHIMGFYHEHQRPDRDCYIYVSPQLASSGDTRILPGFNFLSQFPYDRTSATHYPPDKDHRNFYGHLEGIGRSFAVEFARRFAAGSRMVLVAWSDDGLQQTKTLALANNPYVTVQVHSMDLSRPDPAAYKAILQDEEFRGESYDLAMLVHNAGSVGRVDLLAADIEDPQEWNRYMSLNLYHVTALTAEFLRRFTSGHRCIINVTSLCAVKPFKSMGYYCVGKAAREMYFKVLADENSDLDILNYSPGPVATEMVDNLITTVQDSATREQFEQMRDTNSLVTTELTTQKLVALLASRSYKSGDRFDYYDKL